MQSLIDTPSEPHRSQDSSPKPSARRAPRSRSLASALFSRHETVIAVLAYEGVTAIELVGAYDELAYVPGLRVLVVAAERRPVQTDTGYLQIAVDATLDEVPSPDVLLVPGGDLSRGARRAEVLGWIRQAHEKTRYTAAVGRGALLLAEAGILRGVRATTHWPFRDELARLGAAPAGGRWVESGKIFTAQGGTASIDLALALLARLCGSLVARGAQLSTEYDPAPPWGLFTPEQCSQDERSAALDHLTCGARAPGAKELEIAVFLYPGMTALDAMGPYEVLSRLPAVAVRLVAQSLDPIRCDSGLVLLPTHTLDQVATPDVLVVGGSNASFVAEMSNTETQRWLRAAHASAQYTTSVCTGSLILAAAGLLEGHEATSHWMTFPLLSRFGAKPRRVRVAQSGKLWTGAGVTAGLDFGLTLAGELRGESTARAIQLALEYNPEPPFDSGTPAKAGFAVSIATTVMLLLGEATRHSLRLTPGRSLWTFVSWILRGKPR